MDTRKELLKAVTSTYPLNNDPILTIPELIDIIQKMPLPESEMDEKNDELKDIFMKAAMNGHKEIVKALLDRKMDPNTVNKNGEKLLNTAVVGGHLEIAKLLIAAKADVNSLYKPLYGDSYTPLFSSVVGKKKEMVQLLLDAKADPNKEKGWNSALGFTMRNCQIDIILMLTMAGAVPKPIEFDGLIQDYSDLRGLREGKTHEEVDKLLPAVNAWLNKGVSLESYLSLYRFLRFCHQKNPLVKDSLIKLCELISNHRFKRKYDEDVIKEHVLKPTKEYLKKLQVVMEYKPKKEPTSMWLLFSDQDYIAWSCKFSHRFDAEKVEELYEEIREKRYPYRFFLGFAPQIEPQPEVKTFNQRPS